MPDPVTFSAKDLTKIQLHAQDICPDTFNDRELPTDIHIVHYSVGGDVYFDAVRSYTKVDIFDAYYDKLKISALSTQLRVAMVVSNLSCTEKLERKKMINEYGSVEFYAKQFADFFADVQADEPITGENLIAAFKLALSDWRDYYLKQTAECERLLKKIDEEI